MKRLLLFVIVILLLLSVRPIYAMDPPSGDWRDYGITYTEPTAGDIRWYATHIKHYTVGNNNWRHNLYVSTYNWSGWPNDPETAAWALHVPQVNIAIICWWSGEDSPYPLPQDYVILNTWTEKPSNEPGCNFPLEMNATYKVAVWNPDEPASSAIVSNIHTRHPDEGDDVTQGHYSFDVYFTAAMAATATPSATPTLMPTSTTGPTATFMPTWTATWTPTKIPTVTPTATPTVSPVEAIREAAWNRLYPEGVNYNPSAMFQAVARERGYGAPNTQEFDVGNWRVQGFVLKILYAEIGQWQDVMEAEW